MGKEDKKGNIRVEKQDCSFGYVGVDLVLVQELNGTQVTNYLEQCSNRGGERDMGVAAWWQRGGSVGMGVAWEWEEWECVSVSECKCECESGRERRERLVLFLSPPSLYVSISLSLSLFSFSLSF